MYFLGVDGGGTKTQAIVVNKEGVVLGEGKSGPANHQLCGMDCALSEIETAINSALSSAHLEKSDISFVQYGLAGADRAEDFRIIRGALETLPFKKWDVVCDTLEGLRLGSDNHTGVVLVCGTGTNAAGRNIHGLEVQTGGFGYLYGDSSGGTHISEDAFRRMIRSYEKREQETVLTKHIPEYLGFNSVEALLDHYLDNNISDIPASLAEIVHQAANSGDQVARNILSDSGHELGLAALSVIKRLNLQGQPKNKIPIVLVGSILQKGRNPFLMNSLKSTIEKDVQHYELIIPTLDPVYGAVMLAMDQCNIDITSSKIEEKLRMGAI
ncbi:kinase [Halolactibacillus alkaliphilus]|uniref:Kinase n=1 Tax=Halolactibacillus alkaliphilus TaxID=442899 RepID=A0A511WZT9_9BACI|nr:BadF/BadG/BcrA/BcrD ATPase family protein [Halolactibacillus alkaliphilus]GEN56204.1 kinase [Halolactibacillus alkaliphilus]GGN66587.1 kinase [Halolactibacillus alkaliphilus]SFO67940.1 BadF-type ATPase [Halolactibacillus alkaliphilus]